MKPRGLAMERTVGVILAAGEGQRMGPVAKHFAKSALPICNEPLVVGHLRQLAAAGIRRVLVVVGYGSNQVVRTASLGCPDGVSLTFVEQPKRLGIAHALHLVEEAAAGANLVVLLGDTHFIFRDLAAGLALLSSNTEPGTAAVLSVRPVADPDLIRRECTVRFDPAGRLVEIREKPSEPFNDLKPCGCYFFGPEIFDAIRRTPASPLRGEVEISDSIQTLVHMGLSVRGAPTVEWDRNINFPGDLLTCNLIELRRRNLPALVGRNVRVHPEASLVDSVVGDDARIDVPVRLVRSLVLPGTVLSVPATCTDCILGPGFVLSDCTQGDSVDMPK
ncbi:MAG: hypothetical protein FJ109_16955 [Deltaproteobacteria bacterium]|nr:hypothetical protein [Deltaproteobacteria bacterium]